MMNLQDVKNAVDRLSPEELRELKDYITQRELHGVPVHMRSPEERIRLMDEAAKAIRESFTNEE